MKCVYHPEVDAEGKCSRCNINLCEKCYAETMLHEGLCPSCQREKKIVKYFNLICNALCFIGIGFAFVVIMFIPGNWITKASYILGGFTIVFLIIFVSARLIERSLLGPLDPPQKMLVGLSRYAVTGNKIYMDQAIKAREKVENLSPYEDALYEQLVAVIILQPYDLPTDWVDYLSEKFNINEQEFLNGLLKFGDDMFIENIFNYNHFPAIESLLEITRRTKKFELFNQLIDKTLEKIKAMDLDQVKDPQEQLLIGEQQQQQQQQQQQKEKKQQEPEISQFSQQKQTLLQNRAFLTEIVLVEEELKELLKMADREKDYQVIEEAITGFQLPEVPKNTIEMAIKSAQQQQQYLKGPDQIAGTEDDLGDALKVRVCAECGRDFQEEELQTYYYKDITVNVCSECYEKLEQEGHRIPKLLEELQKGKIKEEFKKTDEIKKEKEP